MVSEIAMSAFDVARVRVELEQLVGARAQKAYQPHYEQVVLRMKKSGWLFFYNKDHLDLLGLSCHVNARVKGNK